MIGVTGLAFFGLNIFQGAFTPVVALLGTTPLMLAVIVGAAQNILSKSSKYSLFDPCKEMAYIPLDKESKTKGKAAIDVIGNPLGKSGGALIQQFLIFGCGSLAAATPVRPSVSFQAYLSGASCTERSLSNFFSLRSLFTTVSCRYSHVPCVHVVPCRHFPCDTI
jgi:ATP/ADP translocase